MTDQTPEGTYRTLTPQEFEKRLKRFPKQEQAFILHQRKLLGIDKEAK